MFILAACALGWPNGYTLTCNRNAHTVPSIMPVNEPLLTSGASLSCDGLNCTLTGSFKGFVVSAASRLTAITTNARAYDDGHCLTHTGNEVKTSVSFTVDSPIAVYAIAVTNNNGGKHTVIQVPAAFPSYPGRIYIVGAGPGGISAGRYLESLNVSVTVFERGPDVAPTFYTGPISNTYRDYLPTNSTYQPFNGLPNLASLVGGNQNANGAVYSAGSARDLARVTGVSEAVAAHAQSVSAGYVEVNYPTMMWACINQTDCDYATVAGSNTKQARRSVAYNHGLANLRANTSVATISSNSLVLENGTEITLNQHDKIIVAAGALMSPQLLGNSTFTGHNHYYHLESRQTVTSAQSFSYENGIETNIAAVPYDPSNPNAIKSIVIRMIMEHDVVEYFDASTPYLVSSGDAADLHFCLSSQSGCQDPWHYGGTVNHDRFKVMPNVYIGDMSAARRPFNCHTSMPASAIGVMSAQAAIGILPQSFSVRAAALDTMNKNGPWYVVGGFLLAVGVIAHVWGRLKMDRLKKVVGQNAPKTLGIRLHYYIMWAAVIAITIGVSKSEGYAVNKNRLHFRLGWVVLIWLWLQAIFGTVLAIWPHSRLAGKAHRVSGIVIMILAIIVYSTVIARADPFTAYENNRLYADLSGGVVAVLVVVVGLSVRGLWPEQGVSGVVSAMG